jgi:hypothetical protein
MLWRRASTRSSAGAAGRQRKSKALWWARVDSDVCLPLFTRTARFDIQPNRFGILGQFGPDRKLQLSTTNLSSIVGWDGRLLPNASIELEVRCCVPCALALLMRQLPWATQGGPPVFMRAHACACADVHTQVYVSNESHVLHIFE